MTREIQIKYTIGKDISYAPMRRSSFSSPKDVKKKIKKLGSEFQTEVHD